MKKIALTLAAACFLMSCGSEDPQGIPHQDPVTSIDVNVAASSNGATVTTAFNASTSANINDGDDNTTWISSPDIPLVIDFASAHEVNTITITKVSAVNASGTNPDILVELSADGVTYQSSNISMVVGGDLDCNNLTFSSDLLNCEMDAFSAQYLRLTSKNGKSFEFKEVEVITSN